MNLEAEDRPSEETDAEAEILELGFALDRAERRLDQALLSHCPRHRPVQRRDGSPPWCSDCGFTIRGKKVNRG